MKNRPSPDAGPLAKPDLTAGTRRLTGSAARLAAAALIAGGVFGSLLRPTASQAAPGHGHVHGQARLDLVLDAGRLSIEAELPMETLTGFERAPRTDDERMRLQRALDGLRAGGLFRPSSEAGCRPAAQTLRWSGSTPEAAPKDDARLPEDETHLDLVVRHEFDCDRPARLAAVEIGLFDVLSRLRRIEARFAGASGAQARTLQRNRRVFEIGR